MKMEIHVNVPDLDLFGIFGSIWCSSAFAATANIGCQYDPDRVWENVDMASLGGVLSLDIMALLGTVSTVGIWVGQNTPFQWGCVKTYGFINVNVG